VSNKEIANAFDDLANIMELHDENQFKIRSFRNAYITLRKTDRPLSTMSEAEIGSIQGIGAAITAKITELKNTGKMKNLEEYRTKTPAGVVDMLQISGFGPKKVKLIWQEMNIESIGELWYACNENRLIEVKGFGTKTQEDLKNKIEYFLRSRDKVHLDTAEEEADFVATWLHSKCKGAEIAAVGALRRRCSVIENVELLMAYNAPIVDIFDETNFILESQQDNKYTILLENGSRITLYTCAPAEFGSKLFSYTGSRSFLEAFVKHNPGVDFKNLATEQAVFEKANLPFIAPELREDEQSILLAKENKLPQLIENQDIKGVLHVHTNWSDGQNTLREMCEYAKELGYAYIGITDHSQAAFYANGLKTDRVLAQMLEIDALNLELAPFRIFKGIESDILNDGNLDYPTEILEKFDFVIASVHTNLKMDKEKATERLLKAIQNPFTTILGHPTGRLLLSREGYGLDWGRIMDACAIHKVSIELNANPYRLDLDWTLIQEATKRGIRISINPDAHSKEGIHDLRYGVYTARKGFLTAIQCLNALGSDDVWSA
jgi:DNA polymerase (family X)